MGTRTDDRPRRLRGRWFGPACLADAPLRLVLLRPPVPDASLPAITQWVFSLTVSSRPNAATPGRILYTAIRAAAAVADNPNDANAHLALGRAYAALVGTTSERYWVALHPQLLRVRQIQASAAFNRAIVLNPKLAQAHLELGKLYLVLDCLDLAVFHLREYRDSSPLWGGPVKGDSRADAIASELERLTKALEHQTQEYAKESERSSVSDRAIKAARRGLGGQARDRLLKSDIGAFGAEGMELERDLLLRTGRPADVLEWTTPEVRGSLRDLSYHWLRSQALIALGDYDEADAETAILVGSGGACRRAEVGKGSVPWSARRSSTSRSADRTCSAMKLASTDPTFAHGWRDREVGPDRRCDGAPQAHRPGISPHRPRGAFRAALAFSPNRWGSGRNRI